MKKNINSKDNKKKKKKSKVGKVIKFILLFLLIVLIAYVINYIVKVIYYSIYNKSGNNIFFLNTLFLFTDCFARALTRVLTLLVCMGYYY